MFTLVVHLLYFFFFHLLLLPGFVVVIARAPLHSIAPITTSHIYMAQKHSEYDQFV